VITKTRIAGLLTALLCAALILFGVLGGLMPQLAAVDATNDEVESAESLNDNYRLRLAMLQKADKESGELDASLDELRKALPRTAATAAWFESLAALEKRYDGNVSLFEVRDPLQQEDPQASAPAPAPGDGEQGGASGDAGAGSDAGAGAGAGAGSGAGGGSGGSGDTGAAAEASTAVEAGPLPIPVTLQFITKGKESDAIGFVQGVQTGSRLFVLSTAQITWNTDKKRWETTVNGELYAFPDEE